MTIRQTNLLMRTATAIMIVASIAVLAMSFVLPLKDCAPGSIDGDQVISATRSPAGDLPPLAEFGPVFTAQLRGKSIAPAPSVASAQGLTLVGTVGNHIALVRSGDTVEARAVGERAGGAEVVAIRAGEADIRTANGIVTLRKAPEAPSPEYIRGARPQ